MQLSPSSSVPNEESDADVEGNLAVRDNSTNGDAEDRRHDIEKDTSITPLNVLQPLRTDPVKALHSRQRRLERLATVAMPELHYIGQISSGKGLVMDTSEGACCRWKIDHGKAWEHLSGEVFGQTQISYSQYGIVTSENSSSMIFNHPLDVHFAAAGLQGWGAPRITVQCYRMDWHGRLLLSGYGFAHLPSTAGPHRIEICLWRPIGSNEQELESYLLGSTLALTSHEPIYESAWRERCRLVTVSAGRIFIDLFVITRFLAKQG